MAFTGSNHLCSTFKKELLEGTHNFANGGNNFKIALFTNSQAGNDNLGGTGTDMDSTITAYSSSAGNEVGNSGSYSAGGGFTLSNSEWFSDTNNGFCRFW